MNRGRRGSIVTVDGEKKKCFCSTKYKCLWHKNPIDRKLRMAMPDGMRDGIDVRIELHTGFEDWGAYETWGSGWIVTGKGFRVANEDLDTAIDIFVQKVMQARSREGLESWRSYMSPTLRIMLDKCEVTQNKSS